MNEVDLLSFERAAYDRGARIVCGIDEAGRGPLAGPVCSAAVILPRELDLAAALPGLNDSKKLSDARRRELFEKIKAVAVGYGIAFASAEEIDEINILQATFLAMARAAAQLPEKPDLALVDGNREPDLGGIPVETLVGGDGRSASIAAASILAKVTRDDLMIRLAEAYPQYGFEIHKGYGTKRHYAALEEFGPSPAHRRSFLRKFYERQG